MTTFEKLLKATEKYQQELLNIAFVQDGINGRWSLEAYQAFLTEAFHHVKHTVPLLMAAGSKFSYQDEDLRDAMAEYIDEELGHQKWILSDIKNSGGDAKAVESSKPGFACELLVSYGYDSIERISPYAFLGMVHVLEGTSVRAATEAADSLAQSLSLDKDCFSYLTSHGSLDISHVDFFASLINKIEDEKIIALITDHAHNFYRLYGNIFRELGERYNGEA